MCAIKRGMGVVVSKGRRKEGSRGRRATEAKANLRSLSKGSDVEYLIFFSVFYLFMLCHHHCQPAGAAQRRKGRGGKG